MHANSSASTGKPRFWSIDDHFGDDASPTISINYRKAFPDAGAFLKCNRPDVRGKNQSVRTFGCYAISQGQRRWRWQPNDDAVFIRANYQFVEQEHEGGLAFFDVPELSL